MSSYSHAAPLLYILSFQQRPTVFQSITLCLIFLCKKCSSIFKPRDNCFLENITKVITFADYK